MIRSRYLLGVLGLGVLLAAPVPAQEDLAAATLEWVDASLRVERLEEEAVGLAIEERGSDPAGLAIALAHLSWAWEEEAIAWERLERALARSQPAIRMRFRRGGPHWTRTIVKRLSIVIGKIGIGMWTYTRTPTAMAW